jgi:hypothetical protein
LLTSVERGRARIERKKAEMLKARPKGPKRADERRPERPERADKRKLKAGAC